MLEEGSMTSKSVSISVPKLGTEYVIRVMELTDNKGGMLERQRYKIRPQVRSYTIKDLVSGATYRVCLGSVVPGHRDELCSTVRTLPKVEPPPPVVVVAEEPDSDVDVEVAEKEVVGEYSGCVRKVGSVLFSEVS